MYCTLKLGLYCLQAENSLQLMENLVLFQKSQGAPVFFEIQRPFCLPAVPDKPLSSQASIQKRELPSIGFPLAIEFTCATKRQKQNLQGKNFTGN